MIKITEKCWKDENNKKRRSKNNICAICAMFHQKTKKLKFRSLIFITSIFARFFVRRCLAERWIQQEKKQVIWLNWIHTRARHTLLIYRYYLLPRHLHNVYNACHHPDSHDDRINESTECWNLNSLQRNQWHLCLEISTVILSACILAIVYSLYAYVITLYTLCVTKCKYNG